MKEILSPVFQEFNRLLKESNEIYHEISLRQGMSDSAFDILYFLTILGEGCTQKDICVYSGLTKQTVNSSVAKLQKDGFLYMEKGRGRDMHIFPTDTGRALILEKITPVMEMEMRAFSSLGDDAEVLLHLSRRYLDSLKKEVGSLK